MARHDRSRLLLIAVLLLLVLALPVWAETPFGDPEIPTGNAHMVVISEERLQQIQEQQAAPVQQEFVLDADVPEELFPELVVEKASDGAPLLDDEHLGLLDDPAERAEAERLVAAVRDGGDDRETARLLSRSRLERFLIQFNRSCDLSPIPEESIRRRIDTDQFVFMVVLMPRPLLRELIKNSCVVKVADPENQEAFFAYAQRVLEEEARERIRLLRLHQSSNDVTGYDDVVQLLQGAWDRSKGEHSPLQEFVTPDEPVIAAAAEGKSPEELYRVATGWLWLSDPSLWERDEHWITPVAFLTETPATTRNPAGDGPASDCSEQANSLVSLLRASGVSAKEVRVAMGAVEFEDNTTGGHAWVELLIDGEWIVLDPTVGTFFDDDVGEVTVREPLPFDYWQYHPFPIHDVWVYYNDEYFLDLDERHAPKAWGAAAGTLLDEELRDGLKGSLWESVMLFLAKLLARLA